MPFLGNFNVGSVGNFGARTFIYDIDPAQNNGRRYGTFLHPDVSSGQFFSTLGSDDVQGGVYLNMNLISVGFKAWQGNNIIDVNLRSPTLSSPINSSVLPKKVAPTAATTFRIWV